MLLVVLVYLFTPLVAHASCPTGFDSIACSACGGAGSSQCWPVGGQFCVCSTTPGVTQNSDPNNPFGTIDNPLPITSTQPGGGLIVILNNVLRLVFVIAGIFAFLKIILAGLAFINAGGDPKKIEAAWATIWQSLIGLVVIIGSFAVAALAGQIFFGRADAILNPTIYGPGT